MRNGQKRMRGRNNNNNHRKSQNPLTRVYESNGPDVKIRGTAHHVAEKYLQLARDAQSSGDPVMAENYLQHAEHYFRLIAAAQAAQQQAQMGYVRQPGESESEDYEDDDDLGGLPDRFASPAERFPQNYQPNQQPMQQPAQPQPFMGQGGFGGGERPPQAQPPQAYQGDRPDRGDRQDRGDRPPRQDRPYQDRNGQNRFNRNQPRDNQPRDNRPPREFRTDRPDPLGLHFGLGQHECFGIHMNRVMLPQLCKPVLRLPGLRRAPGEEGRLRLDAAFGIFPMQLTVAFD